MFGWFKLEIRNNILCTNNKKSLIGFSVQLGLMSCFYCGNLLSIS